MNKFTAFYSRLLDVLRLLPLRMLRFGQHLYLGLNFRHHDRSTPDREVRSNLVFRVVAWWGEWIIYFLECFGIGEIYETIMDLVKFNTRPLNEREIELAKTIFGDNIRYKRVRVDEHALIGPRQKRLCYVSFYIINSWKTMPDSTLIHELTHVWQYEQIGAVYMPRALRAQFSAAGYNYGGASTLRAFSLKDQNMLAFNLEQQADIVEDYFRIRNGLFPCWGQGDQNDLPLYEKMLRPIRPINKTSA